MGICKWEIIYFNVFNDSQFNFKYLTTPWTLDYFVTYTS